MYTFVVSCSCCVESEELLLVLPLDPPVVGKLTPVDSEVVTGEMVVLVEVLVELVELKVVVVVVVVIA
jgi:hypothetical protein